MSVPALQQAALLGQAEQKTRAARLQGVLWAAQMRMLVQGEVAAGCQGLQWG